MGARLVVLVIAGIVLVGSCHPRPAEPGPDGRTYDLPRYDATEGEVEHLRSWLDRGGDPRARTHEGRTLMHCAAHGGQIPVAELLAARGADVNAGDDQGLTPLHVAAQGQQAAMVVWLTAHGADLNARDAGGATPLHAALRTPMEAVHGGHILRGSAYDERDRKVVRRETDTFEPRPTPIMIGPDWGASWSAGSTPAVAVLQVLLEAGADPNVADGQGATPLYRASILVDPAAAALLLDHAADPNAAGTAGTTPLHRAVMADQPEIAELLLAHGGDPSRRDCDGSTALDLAVARGRTGIAKLLRAAGPDGP